MKKDPYYCICCGYETRIKNDIDLTDSYLNYYKLNNSFGRFFILILLQAYPLTFSQP
jgi:hypothetical protein